MRSLRHIVKTQTPSEAQKAYGNYRKLHYHAHGLRFSIENPRGSIRSGVDSSGTPWLRKVTEDYGYAKGTSRQTEDGDHLDVFLSPKFRTATVVHVIDQIDPTTGLFDEHKVMIGWDSQEEAKRAYLSNYERGWKGLGDVTTMTMDSFKRWLKEEEKLDTAGYVVKKAAPETKPLKQYQSIPTTPPPVDNIKRWNPKDPKLEIAYKYAPRVPSREFAARALRLPFEYGMDQEFREFKRKADSYAKQTSELPKYNLINSVRPIYGGSTEAEIAKADAYNKTISAPYRMSNLHKEVPYNVVDSDSYIPNLSSMGTPNMRINMSKQPFRFGGVQNSTARTRAMRASSGLQQFNDIGSEPYMDTREVIAHEGIHGVTANEIRNNPGFLSPTRPIVPSVYKVNTDATPPFKYAPPVNEADVRDLFSGKTGPRVREKDYPLAGMPSYPEMSAPEYIPPLAALQRLNYLQQGHRIESPEVYDALMSRVDAMKPGELESYLRTIPTEAARLYRYRELMKADNVNGRSSRLDWYDKNNRRLIPGIVKNDPNRSSYVLKQASGTGIFGNTLSPITDKLKKLFRSTRAVSTNATQNLPSSPKELFTTSYPSTNVVIPTPRPKAPTGDK